jgi:hypothetical protein
MPPRCECAINNVKNWRPTGETYFNHEVYFCSGCVGLFTLVHMGTVEPDDEL